MDFIFELLFEVLFLLLDELLLTPVMRVIGSHLVPDAREDRQAKVGCLAILGMLIAIAVLVTVLLMAVFYLGISYSV